MNELKTKPRPLPFLMFSFFAIQGVEGVELGEVPVIVLILGQERWLCLRTGLILIAQRVHLQFIISPWIIGTNLVNFLNVSFDRLKVSVLEQTVLL